MKEILILEARELNERNSVFKKIESLLEEKLLIPSNAGLVEKFIERENIVSTGFEFGMAIPHAVVDGIKNPIIVIVKAGDIDWPSMDKNPTNFIISILVPKETNTDHLQILSALTRNIVVDEFREKLLSGTNEEIFECIDNVLNGDKKEEEPQGSSEKFYIGVTKCPVGIAHTYMAAEKLEKTAKTLGFTMKVETQGSQGIENKLTADDIARADGVIIAADVAIEGKARFTGKKTIEVPIKRTLKNTEVLFDEVAEAKEGNFGTATDENLPQGKESIIKFIMNGVSHMIPFVVVGGLFIALSLSLGGDPTPAGLVIPEGSLWNKMLEVGVIGFNLMIPILAGYTAYAMAGRAALAPAMIGAMVANSPELLGTEAGTGFLGAILVGVLVGYLVRWMNSWKVKKELRPLMPIFVIPLIGTIVISCLFIFVIGKPVEFITSGLTHTLEYMASNPVLAIPLGFLLGAMLAFDMGGPVNKVAFLFGVGSIAAGSPEIMGAVACAGAVPPLSTGLATFVRPKKFSEDDRAMGIAALLMGFIGISEGAIPFAATAPKVIIPSIMIGGGVAGALGMFFGITAMVPHTGPIIGVLGAVNHTFLYFMIIGAGTLVSMFLIILFKKDVE